MIGEKIRDYEIQLELGSGGYGVVYRAHDASVDRDVAIKVILPQYVNQPEFVESFATEARLVAALEHPRIVPLYSYWHGERGAFLVMRYVRGGSLREMLAKQGALPLNKVLRLVEQIADALSVAHEAGVVHRDLKPDNILIDDRGNAYLTDFGIAKQLSDDNQSATDNIKGTFAYLSPEQIQQTQVTPQTDIYALGVMLYEMLAGQHPFQDTPVGMMIMKHLHENLPDIRILRDNLDGNIMDVIYKATAKDPEERYASPLALIADFQQAMNSTASIPSAPIQYPAVKKKKPSSPDERNRSAMLENVRNFWIEGVLENSLYDAAMIDLDIKPESGAVDNPWDTLIRTPSGKETLTDENIIDVFDRMNGKLLILGDPGSGKTTTLLTLARDLLCRAEQDEQHPIPVVFNLSSWSENQPELTEWLVEELNGKYQVPRKVGTQWVEDDELLLLLDGLDEVAENVRGACVQAINTYRGEHGFVDVVVCSRIKDYEALTGQLKLNGAIVIQPLDDTQIVCYLDALGSNVAIVRELITRDAQLRELAQSPLMLSIMVLAYQGESADDVPDFDDIEAQRRYLFDVYVNRVLERRVGDTPYSKGETLYYLSWLAHEMRDHIVSVFHIEDLQPSWLPLDQQKNWQWYPRLTHAGIFGMLAFLTYYIFAPTLGFPPLLGACTYGLAHFVWGMVYNDYRYSQALFAHIIFGAFYLITWYVSFASLGSLAILLASTLAITQTINSRLNVVGFIERSNNPNIIRPADKLTFSLSAIPSWFGPLVGGFFAASFVYSFAIQGGASVASFTTLLSTVLGFIAGIVVMGFMLSITSDEHALRSSPNQGIITTGINSLRLSLVFVVSVLILIVPAIAITTSIERSLGAALILGIPYIWAYIIVYVGGYPVLQHILLRRLLERKKVIPRNMAHFLDDASSLILMRKVGGGYIFIHRYLLEYFADMEIETR